MVESPTTGEPVRKDPLAAPEPGRAQPGVEPRRRRFWPEAGKDVAAVTVLVACGYVAPASVAALTNPSELAIGFAGALHLAAATAVVLWIAGLIPFLLLAGRPDGRRRLRLAMLLLAAVAAASGSLFLWNLGVFDGKRVGVTDHLGKAAIELLFVAAATWGVVRLRRALDRRFVAACAGLALFSLVPVLDRLGAVRKASTVYAAKTFSDFDLGDEEILRFSGDGDVLVFVVDALQTDNFQRSLESVPGLREALSGFTCFRNNSGVAPNTTYAVPAMISGIAYDGLRPNDEHVSRVLSGPTALPTFLRARGYDVRIFTQHVIPYAPGRAAWDNVKQEGEENAAASGWVSITRVALYRASPLPVKLWLRDERRFAGLEGAVVRGLGLRKEPLAPRFDDAALLARIGREARRGAAKPVLRWFHLQGAHAPLTLVPEEERPALVAAGLDPAQVQTDRVLARLAETLQSLRRTGISEKATIAVLGDHGLADTRFPALLVKPPAATGPLAFSDAPTSVTDLPATLVALAGLDGPGVGVPAFALEAGAARERRFYEFYSIDPVAGRPKVLRVHVNREPGGGRAGWRLEATLHPALDARKSETRFLDFTAGGDIEPGRLRGDYRRGTAGITWSGWIEVDVPTTPGAASLAEFVYYRYDPRQVRVSIAVDGRDASEETTQPFGSFRVFLPARPAAGEKAGRATVRFSFPATDPARDFILFVDVLSTSLSPAETAALAPARTGVNCALNAVWGNGGGFWVGSSPQLVVVGQELGRILPASVDPARQTFSFTVPAGALARPFRFYLLDPATGDRGPVVTAAGSCPGS